MDINLGDRMKGYEKETRTRVDKNGFIVLRLDGKAFHSYTRGLNRPYDERLMNDMDTTCIYLCENISGAKLGYVQSDEISIIIPAVPVEEKRTELWFDGQVQKMVSVSAGMASAKLMLLRADYEKIPTFDSRIFVLPDFDEVTEYLRFRIEDARKNAVTMAVSTIRSHKELDRVPTSRRAQILEDEGQPVSSLPEGFLNGRFVSRDKYETTVCFVHKKTQEKQTINTVRTQWVSTPAFPVYSAESKEQVANLIK